jgi:hypothetical protein
MRLPAWKDAFVQNAPALVLVEFKPDRRPGQA